MDINNSFDTANDKNIFPEDKISFPWKKIFIILFIFISIIAIFIGYIFYKPQAPNVDIEIKLPDKILSGEGFDVEVIINNNSDQTFLKSNLYLNLPDGVYFLEDDPDKRMAKVEIGDITPSSIFKQNFKLISFSKELSVKTLEVKLTYKLNNSNILFENNSNIDLNISQSVFDISISAPEKIYNAQNFKMVIKYKNNSNFDYNDLSLKIDYPPIFKFISSNPSSENNLWKINQIKKNSSDEVELIGQLIGQEGQSANLVVSILKNISGKSYVLNSQNYSLVIAPSNLALDILLNNDYYYIPKIGDFLEYTFRYKNNLNIPLENIVLTAKLDSPLFDFTNIKTNAHFDSLNNVFIWNSANNNDFKILSPGASGEVSLGIKLKDQFPIQNINDKNFILRVSSQIESPTVPSDVVSNKTVISTNFETKVAGSVSFETFGLYRDPAWQILNKGPYPPKVNQPTQYSIHFRIKNYANDISNVKISGVLQPGTKFTGLYKSNIDVNPKYDPNSGLILINIPKIEANSGVLSNPLEIVLQVENIPSLNQINQNIILFSDIKFEANDDFTGIPLTYSVKPILTDLPNDFTIKSQDRRVSN